MWPTFPRDNRPGRIGKVGDGAASYLSGTVAEIRPKGAGLPDITVNRGLADATMPAEPVAKRGQRLAGRPSGQETSIRRYTTFGQKIRKPFNRNTVFRSLGAGSDGRWNPLHRQS